MTQAEVEARELSRLARQELAALPRGIGDIHGAIAGRVFARARPVGGAGALRPRHDLARRLRRACRGGLWLGATAAGVAAGRRAGDMPLSETPRGAMAIAALNGLFGDRLEAEGSPLAIPMQRAPRRRAASRRTSSSSSTASARPSTRGARPATATLLDDWSRRSSSASTPAATSPRTARRSRRCWIELVARLAGRGRADHAGRALDGRARRPQRRATTAARGREHVRARDLARHAAQRRAARAGRARAERGAAARAGDAAVRALPAPPQRRHPRPAPRLARGRDWRDQDPDALRAKALTEVPLLDGATHCFVAATITRDARHPVGRLLGDMLVLERRRRSRPPDRLRRGGRAGARRHASPRAAQPPRGARAAQRVA